MFRFSNTISCLILLGSVLCFSGCGFLNDFGSSADKPGAKTQNSGGFDVAEQPESVILKVKNNSEGSMKNIQINSGGAKASFDEVKPGHCSSSKRLDHLYRYASIQLEANNRKYRLRPFDYHGEQKLKANESYAYVLELEDSNQISIKLKKESYEKICGNPQGESPESDTPETGTKLRLKNSSDKILTGVKVNSNGAKRTFDAKLNPGECTRYKAIKDLYAYASVRVQTENSEYEVSPYDYHGEKPLEPGKYTYRLQLDSEGLRVKQTLKRPPYRKSLCSDPEDRKTSTKLRVKNTGDQTLTRIRLNAKTFDAKLNPGECSKYKKVEVLHELDSVSVETENNGGIDAHYLSATSTGKPLEPGEYTYELEVTSDGTTDGLRIRHERKKPPYRESFCTSH